MHHHYLSRAPWNADMKHVGRAPFLNYFWSAARRHLCWKLVSLFSPAADARHKYLSVHQLLDPCVPRHMQTLCLPRGPCMCSHSCRRVYCLQYVSGSILPPNICGPERTRGRLGCCSMRQPVVRGLFWPFQTERKQSGTAPSITWTLTLTSRQQAVRSMPGRECFSPGDVKGSDYSLRANSIYTC